MNLNHLAGVGLALLLGCDRMAQPPRQAVYAPWEEGLTLAYEQPDLPPALRPNRRVQLRVTQTTPSPQGTRVQLASTTYQGTGGLTWVLHQGGFGVMDAKGGLTQVLPEGFPDRVNRWETPEGHFQVVGYARPDFPWLPADMDATGVWVEAEMANGVRQRTLYLPDIGEAELRVWQEGRWVSRLRLVSRGFTDAPYVPKQ
jgi:hypothetical protein